MYTFHSTVRCKPGQAEAYQQRVEDPTQGMVEAPGFRKRILLRSVEDRDLFFHISSWESETKMKAFRDSDFAIKWRVGKSLDVFIDIIDRVRSDLKLDEAAGERSGEAGFSLAKAGAPMYLFHSTVHCKPQQADAYEARTLDATKGILLAPGFIRRILLRATETPNTFFYISIWNTQEQLEAYRASGFVTHWRDGRSLEVLTESVDRVTCELVVYDSAPAPTDAERR